MGEYADTATAEAVDADYYGDWQEDPFFHAYYGRWRGFRPRPKTCKRCGQNNLWWCQESDGHWILTYANGVPHVCSLGYKQAFAKLRVDSDADLGYNGYLDNIPPRSEDEVRELNERGP